MSQTPPTGRALLLAPLLRQNPITLQILGLCSALAVTKSLAASLVMSASLCAVLVGSSGAISLLRRQIPHSTRLILQITIIATLVIVTDQVLRAFAPQTAKELSIFVGLIITNCIVLGRAESFARHQPVWPSLLDAAGNGLGYSLVLVAVGAVRELLGRGSLLGWRLLPLRAEGGWFEPVGLMELAPSAFFLIALGIWAVRSRYRQQVEPREFPVPALERGGEHAAG